MDVDTSSSPCYISTEPFLTSQGIKNVPHPQAKVLPHQTELQRLLLTCQVWDTHSLCVSHSVLYLARGGKGSRQKSVLIISTIMTEGICFTEILSSSLLLRSRMHCQAVQLTASFMLDSEWERMKKQLITSEKSRMWLVGFVFIAVAPLVGCWTCLHFSDNSAHKRKALVMLFDLSRGAHQFLSAGCDFVFTRRLLWIFQ